MLLNAYAERLTAIHGGEFWKDRLKLALRQSNLSIRVRLDHGESGRLAATPVQRDQGQFHGLVLVGMIVLYSINLNGY